MKLIHYFPFFILVIIFSCTKPPDYPIEPVIEFKELDRNWMVAGRLPTDSIWITFSFTDGDGDLGNNDTIHDVYLKDTRFPDIPLVNPSRYKLPLVPIQGVGNGISGDITLLVYTSCCTFPEGTYIACDTLAYLEFPIDTLVYEIYIIDRAGHESNRILADPIILDCKVN